MQVTSQLLISVVFWLFAAHTAMAQTLPGFLHAELEESAAPNILSRMSQLRPSTSGYAAAGTRGNGEFSRAVFILTDRSFQPLKSYRINVQLPTPFGSTRWQESYGADVLPMGNNEYVILAAINMNPVMLLQPGSQNLDYAVLRVRVPADEQGAPQVLWANRFGGNFNDTPHNIERSSDGGFIISGYSNPEQALNTASIALTFLVKLDAQGNLQWARRYRNNAADCRTTAFQLLTATLRRPVVQTQDGGFVFPLHCDENAYIVKVNQQGDVLWTKRFAAGAGFFDGFFNQNWNFGLGIATGTGGTIIGVRELPNGNLAFLGNQFSFFTSIWGNPTNGNGGGVVLPVSYVFTTSANGQFLNGAAFFRERFGDNNQPIEMIAHDFQPGQGNRLIVAAGIRQQCYEGPECSFTPALLEINPATTGFDAAVVSAHEITSGSRHFSSHYPFALDFIRIAPPDAEGRIAMSYDKNMVLKSLSSSSPCAPELVGLRSFPITLNLQNSSITYASLTGAELAVGTLSPTPLQRSLLCQTSSAEEPTAAKDSGIIISPTVSDGHFNIQLQRGDEWLGARFNLLDLQGRPCLSGVIQSDRQAVAAGHLPAGVYLVRIVKDAKFTVLKLVIQS
ncbi:MAG: T9SS type A sorting domain-containing protein [Saprospiraceae bacterium]|jgi:hypothetical protein|nr:T9SS type A sorting domain-containing protein [Saprospiraceae bacterium]